MLLLAIVIFLTITLVIFILRGGLLCSLLGHRDTAARSGMAEGAAA